VIDRIIRVDHAGELGADRIYAGQMAVLGKSNIGPLIKEMQEQEKLHLQTFESMIHERRVRPTLLTPLWNSAGFLLGAGTAMLGKEAAMACTEAIEEVIGEHYDSQLRELLSEEGAMEKHKDLLQTLQQFRDEELQHLETGLENGAEQAMAPMYKTLKNVIQTGCRAAIWVAERV
ncbi:predicted protein, partial [Nematostella vectensis]